MNVLAYLPAVIVIAAAAVILVRRVGAFIRTRGRSACENCPYAGTCKATNKQVRSCSPSKKNRRAGR